MIIRADWEAPPGIVALSTSRQGGVSQPPFDAFNLGDHVGDDPQAVRENRSRLKAHCPGLEHFQWLQQVHGTDVIACADESQVPRADACFTHRTGLACVVLTADCLPILLCDQQGHQVAAVHAGWRGLCAGILPRAVQAFQQPAKELMAWIGPAISQPAFEVGAEVRKQFCSHFSLGCSSIEAAFIPSCQKEGHYLCDLVALAKGQLNELGVSRVWGGQYCTFSDPAQFFSYRRDGKTGRMATLIYKQ